MSRLSRSGVGSVGQDEAQGGEQLSERLLRLVILPYRAQQVQLHGVEIDSFDAGQAFRKEVLWNVGGDAGIEQDRIVDSGTIGNRNEDGAEGADERCALVRLPLLERERRREQRQDLARSPHSLLVRRNAMQRVDALDDECKGGKVEVPPREVARHTRPVVVARLRCRRPEPFELAEEPLQHLARCRMLEVFGRAAGRIVERWRAERDLVRRAVLGVRRHARLEVVADASRFAELERHRRDSAVGDDIVVHDERDVGEARQARD